MDIEILKDITVLYVEDELDLKDVTENFLSNIIGRVVSHDNGLDALNCFNEDSFDIVVTDINMPKLNGVELIKEIKKVNPSIPIIVTTAYNNEQQLKELYDAGMDEYIMKPIDLMQLVEKIIEAAKKN